MSHIVKGNSQITDIDVLRVALQNMGLTLKVGGKPRYYYTDAKMYNDEAPECDYVVSLPGKYDLGLKRNDQTQSYDFVCDSELLSGSFGRDSEGRKILGENASKLMNEYVWAAAQQEAGINNFVASREMDGDEQVIYLQRY